MTELSPCQFGPLIKRQGENRLFVQREIAAKKHGLNYEEKWWEAIHTCPNKHCINPDHIDYVAKNQGRTFRIKQGNYGTKLSVEQARYIKYVTSKTDESAESVAARFGITKVQVRNIWHGRSWASL